MLFWASAIAAIIRLTARSALVRCMLAPQNTLPSVLPSSLYQAGSDAKQFPVPAESIAEVPTDSTGVCLRDASAAASASAIALSGRHGADRADAPGRCDAATKFRSPSPTVTGGATSARIQGGLVPLTGIIHDGLKDRQRCTGLKLWHHTTGLF
jgi:hypothetical protein